MNNLINAIRVTSRYKNVINYTECKRFAGHSKWSNIKHIKAEKDGQKQAAMIQLMRLIKVAIAEGKTAKPEDNPKLAKLIESAKKKSLPMTSIKNYLEKAQSSKNRTESVFIESRGPGGCIVLIHLLTDNVALTRNTVNMHLKKTKFTSSELSVRPLFDEKGIVITEADNISLDKATEDAIEVGAEEAEQIEHEGKTFLEFMCHSNDLFKVKNGLEEKNYSIVQADVDFIPQNCVNLNETEVEWLDKLYGRLNSMEDVYKIYNNVA